VADALSAVTGGGEDLSALGEPPPIVLPDDHGDFVTRIVPVTAATDLNGNPISDLSVLTYTPQTSDATVIARTVDPADRLTVHNHVGRVGTARIWIDVGWGVGQVFSTPAQPIEVVAGTVAAVTGMGEDFSRSGLPAEGPDPVA
jgi:hypothetical protein